MALTPTAVWLMAPVFEVGVMPNLDVERLKNYVISRQNGDGGFAICKPLPSSLAETFYAVHILKALRLEVPNEGRVVEFLKTNLRKEPYTLFYIFNSLKSLNREIPKGYHNFLLKTLDNTLKRSAKGVLNGGGTTATYSFEMPSILREVYCITSILDIYNIETPKKVKKFIERFRKNGGFGVKDPNLKETFYCVSVIKEKDSQIVNFVNKFRCPNGGFTKKPGNYPPYIEETYYALSIFYQLGFKHKDEITKKYVISLQNPDGGFRRSLYLGISSLEDTFYAVKSLEYLNKS